MITLRCTRKLLDRINKPIMADPVPSTSLLGDWYANVISLPLPVRSVVIFTSEPTRLTAIVPGRGRTRTTADFQERVVDLLHRLGLPSQCIEREAEALADVQVARTISRSVLGSMNDIAWQIRVRVEMSETYQAFSLEAMEMELSMLLHSPLKYRRPIDIARELCREHAKNALLRSTGNVEGRATYTH